MTTVRPLTVVNCFALPLLSRILTASFPPAGAPLLAAIRKTWLPKNSSELASSAKEMPDSRSREERRISVVGTRSICVLVSFDECEDYRLVPGRYGVVQVLCNLAGAVALG